MPIEFVCPSCKQMLRVPDDAAGKSARCPKCQAINSIPIQTPDAGASNAGASPFSDAASPSSSSYQPAPSKPDLNPYSTPSIASYAPEKAGPQVAYKDGPVRNQVVSAGTVISYAFEIWKANLGLLVGVFVVATVISMVMDFINGFVQEMLEGGHVDGGAAGILLVLVLVGQFAAFAIDVFLGIGQAAIALKLARGQPAEFSDLFSAGPRFWPVLGASILAAIAVVAGLVLCIVPAIVLMLLYWPFYYLIVDGKANALDSFAMAREVTRNNVATTFLLWLASVGIAILGLLACFVGIIFAAPLCSMLFAVGYLMMAGQIPATSYPHRASAY